jgi:hypothetical protein
MSLPRLEEVFKTNGVPTFTFVEPKEYANLILNLRTPGRGVVIEGPSGIGKTTAIDKALQELGMLTNSTRLSSRRPKDIEYVESIPDLGAIGVVIVDDFHKLEETRRHALADYMKTLADEESTHTKLIIIGINKAGENLISFAHDLVNRIDVITFENNSDDKVRALITQGLNILNVRINVVEEIVAASQGSFYLAQMLCRELCMSAKVLERVDQKTNLTMSFEMVRAEVWDRAGIAFKNRCERFCRGPKLRKEGRAPYLHILRWLAEGSQWTLSLRDAIRNHPEMRGSVGQVVDKGYLKDFVRNDEDISEVVHYSSSAEQLTVEDPQFMFYIRNIPWKSFAANLGFMAVEFSNRYDFALSFAGEDRRLVEKLFTKLNEAQVEVFYDRNEQHRMLAVDIEEYLRPIYQSEAAFVIVFLSAFYPKKIWTKFESEQFKSRFQGRAVIPIWFSDAPSGVFDESLRVGGLTYDRNQHEDDQISEIAELLLRKLFDKRATGSDA